MSDDTYFFMLRQDPDNIKCGMHACVNSGTSDTVRIGIVLLVASLFQGNLQNKGIQKANNENVIRLRSLLHIAGFL